MSSSKSKTPQADVRSKEWDSSYARRENYLFYPKEEVVKFLNRFVRKQTGPGQFTDKIDFSKTVRGLDVGCGIGRQTILMHEFGLEAYGVDISEEAIRHARQIAAAAGVPQVEKRFSTIDGTKMDFAHKYFTVTLCESVLDSMRFDIARELMLEIDRVTTQFVFVSLICSDGVAHPADFDGEEVVVTHHEQGTIQSYFTPAKIQRMIEGTDLMVHWCHVMTDESVLTPDKGRRYYVVLKKGN